MLDVGLRMSDQELEGDLERVRSEREWQDIIDGTGALGP
jgi:hypothetical protein